MSTPPPDRPVTSSRQSGYSVGQDRKGVRQAIESVSRWAEPRSGFRVRVGCRNIKHVSFFAEYHDSPGN